MISIRWTSKSNLLPISLLQKLNSHLRLFLSPDYCSRLPHFVNAENAMCVRVPIGGDCEKGAIGTSLVLSTEIGLYLVALSLGESTCSFSLYSRTSPALDWIQKTIAANGIQAGPLSFLTLASLALVVFLAL